MRRTPRLSILFLVISIDLIGFGMVVPFLSFYAREYGASGFAAGTVVGMYSILQFFFVPVWGRLSDRIGRRPILIIGLLFTVISYAMFATARVVALLLASRIVAGGCAANIATSQAYIADMTTPEKRAKGMGIIGAAFGIGFIIGPALSGILSAVGANRGFHGNFLPGIVAASLSLIALLAAFIFLGESKTTESSRPRRIAPQFDAALWRDVFRTTSLAAAFGAIFLILLSIAGMDTSVTLHARDRFQMRQLDIAWLFLFIGVLVGGIQGGLLGRLVSRFGERALAMSGALSLSVGLAIVPSAAVIPMLYLAAFFIAVGHGLAQPSLTAIISKSSPQDEQGSYLGLSAAMGSLARFAGPLIIGVLYDLGGAAAAFYGGAIMTAIALFVAARLPRSVSSGLD